MRNSAIGRAERQRGRRWTVLALGALSAVLCATPVTATADRDGRMSAEIRYTEYGIPHVIGDDYRELGFGVGYAAAKDNLCVIAAGMAATVGESSKYFGPDARPSALSGASTTLSSDIYFTRINQSGVIERLFSKPAPLGPTREVREMSRGYAAGYNKYLHTATITDPNCKGAPWLRPMTELDVYRRIYALGMRLQNRFAEAIVAAQPPGATGARAATSQWSGADVVTPTEIGASNAVAIGGGASVNGRGLVLANPHLPWDGDYRWWQTHTRIPGELDVAGATFLGTPFVGLGFKRTMAWSGTTTAAMPYTLFELKLADGSPTTYLVDGRREKMKREKVKVTVRQSDGSLRKVTRVQWSTRYGPVITAHGSIPLPWTKDTAYAIADANVHNGRFANTLMALGQADSAPDVIRALSETQGAPWWNTAAADSSGRAVHAVITVVPHVTDEHAARCNTALGQTTFPASRLAVLDGSRSSCSWGRDRNALQPGIFAPERLPVQSRPDYVSNSNESHWLSNPREPLTGYPRIVGNEGSERSMRTRGALTEIEEALADGLWTLERLQQFAFSNRNYAAHVALDATVEMCRALPGEQAPGTNGPVDVSAACEVLDAWDGRNHAGSRGALLFDRYWVRVLAGTGSKPWTQPFDVSSPVSTPNTLATANPAVPRALADAVAELDGMGIALDAPYGDNHYVVRDGERIPVPGAGPPFGNFNITTMIWDPARGYTEMASGSSYLHAVAFRPHGCPDVRTLLTYSQSSDPTSPHYSDQTWLFSRGEWVLGRLCEKDVLASPELEIVKVDER